MKKTNSKTSALQTFEQGLTKTEIKGMAGEVIANILENGNQLKIAETIYAMETFLKEVKSDDRIKDYVREEVEKYGKVYTSPSGAKIELAEVGTKYNFEMCGDAEWERLNSDLESIQARIKQRESFLKTVPASGMDMLDSLTGEVTRIYPPAKSSTSSYKVTLAK